MKTSSELLGSILSVLSKIDAKLDNISAQTTPIGLLSKGDVKSKLKSIEDEKNISNLTDSISKLNKELKKLNVKLNSISAKSLSEIIDKSSNVANLLSDLSTKYLDKILERFDKISIDKLIRTSDKLIEKFEQLNLSTIINSTNKLVNLIEKVKFDTKFIDDINAIVNSISSSADRISKKIADININTLIDSTEKLSKLIENFNLDTLINNINELEKINEINFNPEFIDNINTVVNSTQNLSELIERLKNTTINVNFTDNINSLIDSTENLNKRLDELNSKDISTKFSVTSKDTEEKLDNVTKKAEKLNETAARFKIPSFKDIGEFLRFKMTNPLFSDKKMDRANENLIKLSNSAEKLHTTLEALDKLKFEGLDNVYKLISGDLSFKNNLLFKEESGEILKENIKVFSEGVADLNKQLKDLDVDKLEKFNESLKNTKRISKEDTAPKAFTGMSMRAKDAALALTLTGAGILSITLALATARGVLGMSPIGMLGYIVATSAAIGLSMMILAGGAGVGNWIGGKFDKGTKLGDSDKPGKDYTKGAIQNAKDFGTALMLIAGGILSFGVALSGAKALLGADTEFGVSARILGVISMIGLSMLVLSAFDTAGEALDVFSQKKQGFKTRKTIKSRDGGAIQNAKDFGIALMLISGGILSFGLAMSAAKPLLGADSVVGVSLRIAEFIGIMGVTMLALSVLDTLGDIINIGGQKRAGLLPEGITRQKGGAIENAKRLGIALTFIAGGVLAFSVTMSLVPRILGKTSIAESGLVIAGIVLAMGGIFGLLGVISEPIKRGAATAGVMTLGMLALSAGIFIVAKVAQVLTGIGESEAEKDAKKERGKFGEMMATIGPGLGLMGMVIVSSGLLFAAIGSFASIIGLGAIVTAGMGVSLIVIAKSIKTVHETMNSIVYPNVDEKYRSGKGKFNQMMNTIGPGLGSMGAVIISGALLFSGIGLLGGAIGIGALAVAGMASSLISVTKSIRAVNDIMNEMGGTTGINNIESNIKTMISGVMSSVIDGIYGGMNKGDFGTDKIGLKDIAQFRRVNRVLRMLRSVATSLSKFAMGLKAFATVGEIADLRYYEDGTAKIGKSLHVKEVSYAIADTIGTFLTTLVDSIGGVSKREARKIKQLSRSLVGRKGMLSAVIEFSDVLTQYAKYGEKGEVPILNTEGQPTGTTPIRKVVDNITNSFIEFINQLGSKADTIERLGTSDGRLKRLSRALLGRKGVLLAVTEFSNVLNEYAKYGSRGEIAVMDEKGEFKEHVTITKIVENIIGGFTTFIDKIAEKAPQFQVLGSSGKEMRKLSQSLLGKEGKPGILAAISEFSSTLKTYAEFGEAGEIWVPIHKEDGSIDESKSKSVDIRSIVTNIIDSFGTFVTELAGHAPAFTLTGTIGRKMLGLSKALVGTEKKPGILEAINKFSELLITYAEFGESKEIWLPKYDREGNIIKDGMPIKSIASNIIDSFTTFVEEIASHEKDFRKGGRAANKMLRFSEALLGSKGRRGKEDYGILTAITSFVDTIKTYAETSKTDIAATATSMVNSINTFVTTLNKSLSGGEKVKSEFGSKLKGVFGGTASGIESEAKQAEKQISAFSGLINKLDKLAKSQEGMDKLSTSMGSLAENIGLLVNNINALNLDKLSKAISEAERAGKKIEVVKVSEAVEEKRTPEKTETSPTLPTPTTPETAKAAPPINTTAQLTEEQINRLAEAIGRSVANQMKNATYDFTFWDGATSGKLELKR